MRRHLSKVFTEFLATLFLCTSLDLKRFDLISTIDGRYWVLRSYIRRRLSIYGVTDAIIISHTGQCRHCLLSVTSLIYRRIPVSVPRFSMRRMVFAEYFTVWLPPSQMPASSWYWWSYFKMLGAQYQRFRLYFSRQWWVYFSSLHNVIDYIIWLWKLSMRRVTLCHYYYWFETEP